jgi:eukaryotic-like serine/threonine-protein kinase
MKNLSDKVIDRLRNRSELPDLSGTRYRLIRPVARGGMGIVFAAVDHELHRRVALKVLDTPNLNGELAGRLMREARVLARLEHPGIVPVHDVGTLVDGRVFYTMKFVTGPRLDRFIGSVASIPDRLRLFLKICDAVGFAHTQGVLHRDLTPANVMVGSFGEVMVMDWGLAKILADIPERNFAVSTDSILMESDPPSRASLVTGDGRVMGTPGYMSPEQARGEAVSLDPRSDIFSLGAMLRFVLGQERAAHSTLPERALQAICAKASAPERDERYANVHELAQDVSRFLDGLPVQAYRENIFERLGRFYRRYRFFILVIAAYLLVRVLLVLFYRHPA